jgi:NAD(P)-dependent dehydrogenase (short-subunit alcohol dehydrogenase family)
MAAPRLRHSRRTKNAEEALTGQSCRDQHFDRTLKTLWLLLHGTVGRNRAIVMNGSVTGLLGSSHLLDYSMTKGGIHTFTRSLASNLVGRDRPRAGVDTAQSGRQPCRARQGIR